MIEKITYIAFDGTEFEDEDECRDYETAQEAKNYHWAWFDYSNTRLEPKPYNLDSLTALILTNEKEHITMVNWLRNEGYAVDGLEEYHGEGLYYYDTDKDVWKYWPEEMRKLIAFGAAFGQKI